MITVTQFWFLMHFLGFFCVSPFWQLQGNGASLHGLCVLLPAFPQDLLELPVSFFCMNWVLNSQLLGQQAMDSSECAARKDNEDCLVCEQDKFFEARIL